MLAMSDSDGILEAAVTGIASVAKVSVEKAQIAIEKFLAPDKLSTNLDNDGRRIERIREGYKILNYQIYREKDHTAAARQRKHRELSRVTGVTSPSTYVSVSNEILSYLNLKTGRKYRNAKEILPRLGEGHTIDEFIKIIDTKIKDPYFIENPHYLSPTTLFRKSHFDTYLNQRPEDFRQQQKPFGGYVQVERPEQSNSDMIKKFIDNFPEQLLPIKGHFQKPEFTDKLIELFKNDNELNSKFAWHKKQYPKSDELLYRKNYLYAKYGIPEVENEENK